MKTDIRLCPLQPATVFCVRFWGSLRSLAARETVLPRAVARVILGPIHMGNKSLKVWEQELTRRCRLSQEEQLSQGLLQLLPSSQSMECPATFVAVEMRKLDKRSCE